MFAVVQPLPVIRVTSTVFIKAPQPSSAITSQSSANNAPVIVLSITLAVTLIILIIVLVGVVICSRQRRVATRVADRVNSMAQIGSVTQFTQRRR